MTCNKLGAEVLLDHVLGDLDRDTRARVDAHLAVCPYCREGRDTISRLNEIVWATREFQDIQVPPEVHQEILERCRVWIDETIDEWRSGDASA